MGMGATLSKLLCLEIFLLSLRLANEFYIYIYIYIWENGLLPLFFKISSQLSLF